MQVTAKTENTRLHIDFDEEDHWYEFHKDRYTYRELDSIAGVMRELGIEEMDEDECPHDIGTIPGWVRVFCAEIPHQIPRHVREGRIAWDS